jgi:hypothetical protein
MSDNLIDSDPISAILQQDQADQQRRKQEDAETDFHRSRSNELRAAFEAVRRFTDVVFDGLGYQKGRLTTQEFIEKWADLWVELGDQLRDKREYLSRQPEDLRAANQDAPRSFALAVLNGAIQGDKVSLLSLFQELGQASAKLQAAVNEWLRHQLQKLIMGHWTVGEGGRPQRESWYSEEDWHALLNMLQMNEAQESMAAISSDSRVGESNQADQPTLESLISRPVETIDEYRHWLEGAETFVRSLPGKSESGNERTDTHNSAALYQAADRLHDLVNEYAPELATLCTVPGKQVHFTKPEVIRNIRLLKNNTAAQDEVKADQAPAALVSLDEEDILILRGLKKLSPRLCTADQVAGHAIVSDRTVKTRLRGLIDSGLVHRPKGKKSGATITALGIEYLEKCPEPNQKR